MYRGLWDLLSFFFCCSLLSVHWLNKVILNWPIPIIKPKNTIKLPKNFWNYTNAHTRQIFWIIILSAWLMVNNTTKPKIPWKNYWKPTIAIKIFWSTWAISINNKGKPINRRNVTGKQSKKLFRKIQQSLIWPINLKISGNIAGRSRLISKAGYFWKNRMPFWKN